jgi:hypothetical protein
MNVYPAVLRPSRRAPLVADIGVLLYTVQLGAGTIDDDAPFPEPSEDQVDYWMGVPVGWQIGDPVGGEE